MASIKLTKFGHQFCGPCKMIKPILDEIVKDYSNQLDFEDVDTYNTSPERLGEASIRAVPTLILYKDGVEVWRHVGLTSRETIENKIKENL